MTLRAKCSKVMIKEGAEAATDAAGGVLLRCWGLLLRCISPAVLCCAALPVCFALWLWPVCHTVDGSIL